MEVSKEVFDDIKNGLPIIEITTLGGKSCRSVILSGNEVKDEYSLTRYYIDTKFPTSWFADEHDFDNLQYVKPDRFSSIRRSILSEDQYNFMLDQLNVDGVEWGLTPYWIVYTGDNFPEEGEVPDEISFNDIFKLKES